MILRRPEFRKARLRRRQHWRRWPMPRSLKKIYGDLREQMLFLETPLIACLERNQRAVMKEWGGTGHYWDVTVSGAATTRNTSQEVASVNYEATGTVLPRPRFWRNPFVR